MPTLFQIFGLRFYFYSLEHTPIHVHVQKEDSEAKIEVSPDMKVIYNHGLKPQDLKRAVAVAELYRDEIISKWEEYHGDDDE